MKNRLLFVISHQPNPRFIKQINYFSENGFKVNVIYFYREYLANLNKHIDNNVNIYLLDNIENGKYLKRIGIYLKSIFKLKKLLKKIQPQTIILTNTDILLLLIINRIKLYTNNIIMEISDLPNYTFDDSITSKLQRYLDKIFLRKYISKMIYTSPKFYEFYYQREFKGQYLILENKPLLSILPPRIDKKENKKIIIGIVGLLLYFKPYKALFDVVKNRDDIEVHIYGKGIYEEEVESYAKRYCNIKYFGVYDFFTDISKIYASLDMVYISYDTTKGDINIKLALPNKLYEAIYFKVPIIATRETYLAQRVIENHIGYVIKCCQEEDIEKIISKYRKDKDIFCSSFDKIESNKYLADTDYNKLIEFI